MRKLTKIFAALSALALCGVATPDETMAAGGTWHWTDGKGTWHWSDWKEQYCERNSERCDMGEDVPEPKAEDSALLLDTSDSMMIFWQGAYRALLNRSD